MSDQPLPETTIDGGKSLVDETIKLREQVAQLCTAVRQLVQLQSVANQKLDCALKGGIGADFGVIG